MTQKQLSLVHSSGAHSPSRVVVIRLRLLGSANLRFGLHRLRKQYAIVFSALTQRGAKNPESVSVRDFYFLRIHFSLKFAFMIF